MLFKKQYLAVLPATLITVCAQASPLLYTVSGSDTDAVASDTLSTVNVDTGETTTIGKLNANILDIAFDDNGTLYGTSRFDSNASGGLYKINPKNASLSFVGDRTAGAKSADINTNTLTSFNNKLYTSGSLGSVYSLNKDTAKPTFVTTLASTEPPLGFPSASPTSAFGVNNGMFYVSTLIGEDLFEVDLETGAADLIGPLGDDATGLASDQNGIFYGTGYDGAIYKIATSESDQNLKTLLFDSGLNQITGATFGIGGEGANPPTGGNGGSMTPTGGTGGSMPPSNGGNGNTTPMNVVPEPGSLTIMMAGLLAIFGVLLSRNFKQQ